MFNFEAIIALRRAAASKRPAKDEQQQHAGLGKRGDGVDRAALWAKAMKRDGQALPRIEGE